MEDHQSFVFLTDSINELESDCDCACPSSPFHLNFSCDPVKKYTTAIDKYTVKLPNRFYLLFSAFAPSGPSVVNVHAWNRYQDFVRTPKKLSQAIDYRFAEQKLLIPLGESPKLTVSKPETFTVWLHVTNACNLDCPYCYVRKSSSRMDKKTGIEAIAKVFQAASLSGFKKIKLKYAGGEATLHFKLVQLLHNYARQLAEEYKIELLEVVLSNGVHIRPEIAKWLSDSGLKLMISVDGIGEAHDQQRPLKKGGKTFALIEHTIDAVLLPAGIKPDISVTITSLNACGIADMVDWILQRELPFSLNFYRENTLSSSRESLQLEEIGIIEGMKEAYRVIENSLPTRPIINSLLDKVRVQAHTHTCGVGKAYAVITHRGELAQCQMHLDQPVGDNLNAKTMIPLLQRGPIRNITVDEKIGCRDCTYRYRCTGGCPLETYRATGRWDVKSPNCNIYKTLYPLVLRLEGLRLMKQHGYF